jgi:hypothetical protein
VARPWLASLAVFSCAALARGEPREEAVRLQYAAPRECPDSASFTAQLRERTARGRLAEPGELARTFSVSIAANPRGFAGGIEFLDESGATVSRRVQGEQCEAVVSSLALIAALALDASLRAEPAEPTDLPRRLAPAPPAPGRAVVAPPRPPAARPTLRQRSLESARIGLTVGYGSALGAPQLGLLGQLDWRSGLALRLGAHYAWRELSVDAGREAKLRSQALATSLCFWRVRVETWSLAPCAAVELGSLRAEGVLSERLPSARGDTIWWAAVGAELGLAWEPRGPFWVELRGSTAFPLRAGYRFTFENPGVTAYKVPYFAGSGALAAGVRFW